METAIYLSMDNNKTMIV